MIGGYDLSFPGTYSSVDLTEALRLVRAAWPDGVVESGDGARVVAIAESGRVSWPFPCELFIYPSRAAYEAWSASGETLEHASDMISVYLDEEGLSFVVDGAGTPSEALVQDIMRAIRANPLARSS